MINKIDELKTTYLCSAGGVGGAGKDFTIGKIVSFLDDIASTDKNATTLKDIVNVAIYELYYSTLKEKFNLSDSPSVSGSFTKPIFSENEFEDIKNDNSYKLPFDKNLSVREVLQTLGTDVIRNISTDFHVKMLSRRIIASEVPFIFITDARFDNEYNFVKDFNSKNTPSEKMDYLRSISVFEEDTLPSRQQIRDDLAASLGDNDLSNILATLLIDCFYDEKFLVNSYTHAQQMDNDSLQKSHVYSHDFLTELKDGALFVLRDSTRDVPNHSSEKHNNDIIASIPGLPQHSVFHNEFTPIEDNPQFKTIIEYLMTKAANNYYLSGELILADDIVISDSMPNTFSSLSKIISTAKLVPSKLKEVISNYHTQYEAKLPTTANKNPRQDEKNKPK